MGDGRVLIVGAGVAGLATAIALRQRGTDAIVFDRAPTPQALEVGGGLNLWPNAFMGLRQLGLEEQVAAAGFRTLGIRFMTASGKTLTHVPLEDMQQRIGAPLYSLSRPALQRVLMEAMDDEALELGEVCEGFEQDASGVEIRFAGGRRERGDALVAADGIDSRLRGQLFPGSKAPRYSGRTLWVANAAFDHESLRPELMSLSIGRRGRFMRYGIGDGRVCWYVDANLAPDAPETERDPRTFALSFCRGWSEPVEALIEATDDGAIHYRQLYDIDPLPRWSDGRVTLLGDAAHAMLPDAAQGACQAIEDAVVLAKCLHARGDASAALRSYEQQRLSRTKAVQKEARRNARMMGPWNPAVGAVRDQVARFLGPVISKGTERVAAHQV